MRNEILYVELRLHLKSYSLYLNALIKAIGLYGGYCSIVISKARADSDSTCTKFIHCYRFYTTESLLQYSVCRPLGRIEAVSPPGSSSDAVVIRRSPFQASLEEQSPKKCDLLLELLLRLLAIYRVLSTRTHSSFLLRWASLIARKIRNRVVVDQIIWPLNAWEHTYCHSDSRVSVFAPSAFSSIAPCILCFPIYLSSKMAVLWFQILRKPVIGTKWNLKIITCTER